MIKKKAKPAVRKRRPAAEKKPEVKSNAAKNAQAPEAPAAPPAKEITPIHQWTYGDRVLMVKCVERGGKSHGGFQWPMSGNVTTPNWSPKPDCDSGGLFGWPWGLNLGIGKRPNYLGDWIVFSAPPEAVVLIEHGKVKVQSAEVVYYGSWAGALEFTRAGRESWLSKMIRESCADWSGAASATGESGAASATGGSGAASATGESGAASATGGSGAASATGWSGAASATGERGAASATGESGAASATGWRGAASATGESGAASATGWRGAASATGESGAASATGERGAASATGGRGAASATGGRGAASLTGPRGKIEVGPRDAGLVTSDEFDWVVHPGAVVLHRWEEGHALLTCDGLPDGEIVHVVKGVISRPRSRRDT